MDAARRCVYRQHRRGHFTARRGQGIVSRPTQRGRRAHAGVPGRAASGQGGPVRLRTEHRPPTGLGQAPDRGGLDRAVFDSCEPRRLRGGRSPADFCVAADLPRPGAGCAGEDPVLRGKQLHLVRAGLSRFGQLEYSREPRRQRGNHRVDRPPQRPTPCPVLSYPVDSEGIGISGSVWIQRRQVTGAGRGTGPKLGQDRSRAIEKQGALRHGGYREIRRPVFTSYFCHQISGRVAGQQ